MRKHRHTFQKNSVYKIFEHKGNFDQKSLGGRLKKPKYSGDWNN